MRNEKDSANAEASWTRITSPFCRLCSQSRHVTNTEELEVFFGQILDAVLQVAQADTASLMFVDEARGELVVAQAKGFRQELKGMRVPLEGSVAGEVVREGKPRLLVGDIGRQPRELTGTPASSLSLPLQVEAQRVGVLNVNRYRHLQDYTEKEMAWLQQAADTVAVAVENARLHQRNREQIQELARLNQELNAANQRLREAQVQLLHTEKMAAIGHLAAGVAHEINNPMGFIHANLHTLSEYVKALLDLVSCYEALVRAVQEKGDPEWAPFCRDLQAARERLDLDFIAQDVPQLIAESLEGVERVKQVVQSLRPFSGKAYEAVEVLDINQVLQEALTLLGHAIPEGVTVRKDFQAVSPMEGAALALHQAFMNVLRNGIQAMEGQGELCLRTWEEEKWIRVEITDTGSGIAPEHLNRVFDPFFTTREVGEGRGLGLSVAYHIVREHGGDIQICSRPGHGTTVTFRFPRLRTPVSADSREGRP